MPPSIPWYITLIVVTTNIAVAVAVWSILASATTRSRLPRPAQQRARAGAAILLGAWLAGALLIAPSLGPSPGSAQPAVPPVVVFSAAALAVVVVALGISPSLRGAIAGMSLPSIIGVQVYRVIGVVFLILLGQGKLPAHFALPAGWGDVAIGLAAPLVALALASNWRGSRAIAVSWNVLGLLDLVVAVGMGSGLLVPLLAPGLGSAPPAAAMGALPMILVPAFAVPVSVLLHLLALGRLWSGDRAAARLVANPAR
jgi:hypothetical protein